VLYNIGSHLPFTILVDYDINSPAESKTTKMTILPVEQPQYITFRTDIQAL